MGTSTDPVNDDNNNVKVNGDLKKFKTSNLITTEELTHQNGDTDLFNNKILWDPKNSLSISQKTHLMDFQGVIEKKFSLHLNSYNDFYNWSCENYLNFWEEFWSFSNLLYSQPYSKVKFIYFLFK